MPAPQLAEDAIQLTVLAPPAHAMLAAETLARQFDLTLPEAETILARGHGTVTHKAAGGGSLALLTALGVRMVPVSADTLHEQDMSLRLTRPDAAGPVLRILSRLGIVAAAGDFGGPAGLVLHGVARPRAEALKATLAGVAGVEVRTCPTASARFDLFAGCSHRSRNPAALRHLLTLMGCDGGGPGRALATGIDRRTVGQILARCPDDGLFAVNQLFQRYDLLLTGPGTLDRHELRDFLATRGLEVEAASARLARDGRLRIEAGLSRRVAQQFLSDYAQIGLPARAELVTA